MRIWAVTNQKGGVGKTTTAVTIGGLLAHAGESTLLLDLDPHGSLSIYLGYDPDDIEGSVYNLFQYGSDLSDQQLNGMLRSTKFDNLYLIPASSAQATLDKQLGAQDGMGLILKSALARLGSRFQHVLIDCPPMLGVLMVNALAACDHLLIPVQTEFLALKGLERMLNTLEMVQRARHEKLEYTIVPTMFDRRTRASIQTLRAMREQYGDNLWQRAIPIDTRFREASRAGVPLSLMQRHARGVLAYSRLIADLLGDESPVRVINV